MTILSDWLEKKESNKTHLMSVAVVMAGIAVVQGVNQYREKGDHPTELAKIAISMEKTNSLAQDQIRMFPAQYEKMKRLLAQGQKEEATKFAKDFIQHIISLRDKLPEEMKFGIAKLEQVDGFSSNLFDALDKLEPALRTKDQDIFEDAVSKLYVAIDRTNVASIDRDASLTVQMR